MVDIYGYYGLLVDSYPRIMDDSGMNHWCNIIDRSLESCGKPVGSLKQPLAEGKQSTYENGDGLGNQKRTKKKSFILWPFVLSLGDFEAAILNQ